MKILDKTDIVSGIIALVAVVTAVSLETALENAATWLVLVKWVAFAVLVASITRWEVLRRERANADPALDAYAYLDPVGKTSCFIKWTAPRDVANLSLVLDVKPVRQPTFRQRLRLDPAVAPGERVKTEIFSHLDNSWRWATPEGGIMHDDPMTCRLVVLSNGKPIATWRFAIPERHFSDTPQVVGENLFNAPLS